MATTLGAPKGRLIRCTVPGLTPNLAAILRTRGLPGVARTSQTRFSRAGAIGEACRRNKRARESRKGGAPLFLNHAHLTASLKAAGHAVLERAGSSQTADGARIDVVGPRYVRHRFASGKAV
jgi:hypothetical protein